MKFNKQRLSILLSMIVFQQQQIGKTYGESVPLEPSAVFYQIIFGSKLYL